MFKLLKINNIFIILAIISGMTAYILHTSYLKTKYQIKTQFSNDSLLISEWIKSEFKASDYVLRDIISQTSLSELRYPPTDPEKYQQKKAFLERKRKTLPFSTLAGLFDKNCIVTHSNTIDGFDASEREYCQRMMNEPKLKTFVSHAFMSNMGFLNVTQTRRFNTEDGFLGMAAFGIDLSYFSEHLDVLQENNSTIIRIFDTKMLLIAKKPFQSKEIGTTSSEKFIEKFIESGEKIRFIDRPLLSDQNDTIFFLRKVDELPFIIVMGVENKNALLSWYQRVLIIAFFLLAILLMAFIIVKNESKIIQQNKALRKKEEELRLLATTDSLTGLLNRHGIKKLIEQEIKRFNRKAYPISLILLDIDHFKVINDKFGHPVGDKVLQLLSSTLQAVIRDTDYLVRWGGEEFLILATDTSLANAVVLSEKIRSALEKLSQPELPAFTVSIGVSEYQEQDSFDCWYNRTDAALYEAKENGRNRVVSSNKKMPSQKV